MMRLRTLMIAMYVGFTFSSFGQIPKPSFEISSGIQLYKFNGMILDSYAGSNSTINQFNPIFTFMGSVNIPLKKVKEDLYLGINPNASVGYSFGTLAGDLPIYATLKYGAASTKDSPHKFGVGAGAGFFISGLATNLTSQYNSNLIYYSTGYITPAIMAEISFLNETKGIYQLRTDFTPYPILKTGVFTGNISQYNIRIIRIF